MSNQLKDLKKDVSIIIVNYNTKILLFDCLSSIYEQTEGIDFEVIVSDNGSTDGSIDMLKLDFPQVILIENNANLGFGGANNRGLAIAKGKYIFYLNSDTILLNNAVKYFYDYWEQNNEQEKLGALGANLLDKNYKIGNSHGDFPSINKDLNNLIHLIYGINKICLKKILWKQDFPKIPLQNYTYYTGEVKTIIGADLFLKNDTTAKFDENFFMYYDEIDLEYELNKIGKVFLLIEGPLIIHLGEASSKPPLTIIEKFSSFKHKEESISKIYYYKKRKISKAKIFLFKMLTLILWCNPYLFQQNKKMFLKIIKA